MLTSALGRYDVAELAAEDVWAPQAGPEYGAG